MWRVSEHRLSFKNKLVKLKNSTILGILPKELSKYFYRKRHTSSSLDHSVITHISVILFFEKEKREDT